MTFLLIVYSKKISNFCFDKFSCDLLNEEAKFFGLISIVGQFYVLKNFDKHFKRSFEQIKLNFIRKQQQNEHPSSRRNSDIELRHMNNNTENSS